MAAHTESPSLIKRLLSKLRSPGAARGKKANPAAFARSFWSNASSTFIAGDDYYERCHGVLAREILPLLSAETEVLDYGCGDGEFTFDLAPVVAGVDAYDLSAELIRKAREAATERGVNNVRFDIRSAPTDLAKESYDLVCCMGVLVCIVDDHEFESILAQLAAKVRPGGRLLLRETVSGLGRVISESPEYVACYRTLARYHALLGEAGLELELDTQLAEWSAEEQRTNHLLLVRRPAGD